MYNTTTGRDTLSARTERSTTRCRLFCGCGCCGCGGASLRFRIGAVAIRGCRSFFLHLCSYVFLGSVLYYFTFLPPHDTTRRLATINMSCQWLFLVLTNANSLLFATSDNGELICFLSFSYLFRFAFYVD